MRGVTGQSPADNTCQVPWRQAEQTGEPQVANLAAPGFALGMTLSRLI